MGCFSQASAEEVTLEEEAPVELTEQQRKEAEKQVGASSTGAKLPLAQI